jgi:hypothetical protein
MWKEVVVVWFKLLSRYFPGWDGGLSEAKKSLSQGSRYSGWESNQSFPEYKIEALSSEPPCSVHSVIIQKTAVWIKARVWVCFRFVLSRPACRYWISHELIGAFAFWRSEPGSLAQCYMVSGPQGLYPSSVWQRPGKTGLLISIGGKTFVI